MEKIKYLIFGLRNLMIEAGAEDRRGYSDLDSQVMKEFGKLIGFARSKNVQPVVFANRDWQMTETQESAKSQVTKRWGPMEWLIAGERGWPFKPQAGAMSSVLRHLKCKPNEVLYIGNHERDMRTAVNGGVLFMNATW
jgi:hypothetical protein